MLAFFILEEPPMQCYCRRCTLDSFNRDMWEGSRCSLPADRYYCDICHKPECERADDHRLMCRRDKDKKARWALYWNGKEMQR